MISFGIDIGTTTLRGIATQVSLAPFEKRSYSLIGKPLCQFTPFTEDLKLDQEAILAMIQDWILSEKLPQPDVGTILFTGEAQRASNASHLGNVLTNTWHQMLSAQLDPELESRIAAYGSGAVKLSTQELGIPVLHIDIGGGTSNFAWIENGQITDTSCLDLGCRKWVLDPSSGKILKQTKASERLVHLFPELTPSTLMLPHQAEVICYKISQLILSHLKGRETNQIQPFVVVPWKYPHSPQRLILSLSGGMVDALDIKSDFQYGDLGPVLGRVFIEQMANAKLDVRLCSDSGRATALGISAFGFQVSGSSIYRDLDFPEKKFNIRLFNEEQFEKRTSFPECFAITLHCLETSVETLKALAENWVAKLNSSPISAKSQILFLLGPNIAKTFGHFLKQNKNLHHLTIAVLDEVAITEVLNEVNTVDLARIEGTDRFTVIIKSLNLF